MNGYIHASVIGWINGCMNARVDEEVMGRWMGREDVGMDEWVDAGWMDGWMCAKYV